MQTLSQFLISKKVSVSLSYTVENFYWKNSTEELFTLFGDNIKKYVQEWERIWANETIKVANEMKCLED